MTKKIVFCTLRDNLGATGGPGGVVFMIKKVLGGHLDGYELEYRFNPVKIGGRYKKLLNILFFYTRCLFDKNSYYVAHDIDTGAILSRLHKDYSLVYHNQGPIVQELLNLGRDLSLTDIDSLLKKEKAAFTGAKSVHCPSSGASEMYFTNSYATCRKDEVILGEPLYNTIPIEEPLIINDLKKEPEKITFFSLGTLTDAKGQDKTIDFIERYVCNNPAIKVRYIVVGKGPLLPLLHKRANEITGKNSNFEFIYFPSLKHSEVMYVHQIADVYIMLHRISIFDFATLEAMLSKTAIVLSPIGGNLDFDKDDNIIYVKVGEEEKAIKELTREKCELMKTKNFDVFNKFFSEDSFKNEYIKLIKDKAE